MDAFYLTGLIATFLTYFAENGREIVNGVAIDVLGWIVIEALRRR